MVPVLPRFQVVPEVPDVHGRQRHLEVRYLPASPGFQVFLCLPGLRALLGVPVVPSLPSVQVSRVYLARPEVPSPLMSPESRLDLEDPAGLVGP